MLIHPDALVLGMGLFRKAGAKFEETKRSLMTGGDVEFVCRACEEPLTQEYDECPHCGADAVESVD